MQWTFHEPQKMNCREEARWSCYSSPTSVNVCGHEVVVVVFFKSVCAEMAACMNVYCISLHIYLCVHCIQLTCVPNCAAFRASMM